MNRYTYYYSPMRWSRLVCFSASLSRAHITLLDVIVLSSIARDIQSRGHQCIAVLVVPGRPLVSTSVDGALFPDAPVKMRLIIRLARIPDISRFNSCFRHIFLFYSHDGLLVGFETTTVGHDDLPDRIARQGEHRVMSNRILLLSFRLRRHSTTAFTGNVGQTSFRSSLSMKLLMIPQCNILDTFGIGSSSGGIVVKWRNSKDMPKPRPNFLETID